MNINEQWFMQDGATAHTTAASREFIRDKFQDRVISLKTDFVWAPHSPDLNPLDFFLWSYYLKDIVYREAPQTIHDLKTSIIHHVRNIDIPLCDRVIRDFKRRVDVCFQRQGRHMEHVL